MTDTQFQLLIGTIIGSMILIIVAVVIAARALYIKWGEEEIPFYYVNYIKNNRLYVRGPFDNKAEAFGFMELNTHKEAERSYVTERKFRDISQTEIYTELEK